MAREYQERPRVTAQLQRKTLNYITGKVDLVGFNYTETRVQSDS